MLRVAIHLVVEGANRFRILLPFLFEDGDHLAIVLKREDGQWILSDEGHICMRLADVADEACVRKTISEITSKFGIKDCQGELIFIITDDRYAGALCSFVQAILEIAKLDSYCEL